MTGRVLWFLIKIGIIAALVVWLTQEPGRVSIDWLGWAVDMPVGVALLAIGLLVFLFVHGERIRHAIFAFPSRWRAQRKAIREMKGYRALTLGLVAVAAGDAPESRRQSRRARDLLTDAPLTKLLTAQTARLDGDDEAARKYFEDMRADPEVAFLGIRGLMTQALQAGDKDRALALAEEARKLRPSAKWVLIELLNLQMDAGKWSQALTTLDEAERTGALIDTDAAPIRARLSRRRALLLRDGGKPGDALKAAERALKAAPTDPATVVLAAELRRAEGKARKADQLLEAAWKQAPDAAVAEAYGAGAERALDKVKRIEKLVALAPEDPAGHLALASVSLDAELWGEARTHLAKATELVGDPPGPAICRMWARLEESEHNDLTAAHDWLRRAVETEPSDLGGKPDAGAPVPVVRSETLPV
jgi:HemY protein